MVITFAGHSFITSSDEVKKRVKEEICKHVEGGKQISCYLGGYGDFDQICARACRELKREYGNIELVYVTPYLRPSEQEKIKEMQLLRLYDTSIYPPIENVPLKFAISKRNEWMMANADLVIAYVKKSYGGAYKSLQVAKRKKKQIINIYDLISQN